MMPRTIQRWMILAIPVGLTIGIWCVFKAWAENRESRDTVRPLGL